MAKTVEIRIIGNATQAIAALEQVGIKAEETAAKTDSVGAAGEGSSKKINEMAKWAALGVAALGVAAVDLGNKLEDAHAALSTAVKAAGGNMGVLQGQITSTDSTMEKFGFTNAQTESALTTMTIALKNPTKAMSLMSLAADIARARHIDLAAASTLVVKASEGQTMALRRAGIDLPVMASNALKVAQAHTALAKAQQAVNAILAKTPDAVNASSKAHAKYEAALAQVAAAQTKLSDLQTAGGQVIDALSQRYAGQASTAADTFSGRMEVARARVEDLGARIGIALIPVLERLMVVVAGVVTWLTKHKAVAEALGIVVGTILVAAVVAYTISMISAAVATIAATWPILAIIAAVALLALGIFYLATHWHQVWTDIKQWTGDAVNFIRDHWYMVLAIPVVGWLIAVALNWNRIYKGISDAASWALTLVTGAWNTFLSFFSGIGASISRTASGMWNGIVDGFRSAIDYVIGLWNSFASSTSFTLPSINLGPLHVGGQSIGPVVPTIPLLATGGFVTSEGLAYIHTGEQVVPAAKVAHHGGGADSGDLYLTVSLDKRNVAEVIVPEIRTLLLQGTRRNATRVGFS